MQYPKVLASPVVIAERLKALMSAANLSQAELARRVGVRQPTIFKLTTGGGYGSKHLHRIARELGTSTAYLEGETDDPDENAPPPPLPTPRIVTMEVVLPREAALEQMFEALLETIDEHASRAELAQLLAQRLPIGLSQLRDLRPDSAGSPASRGRRAAAHPVALPPDPEPAS